MCACVCVCVCVCACVCVPHRSAVCDNEMHHVETTHLKWKQGCFPLDRVSQSVLSPHFVQRQKHDDRSSSKRRTVCYYQETLLPVLCFFSSRLRAIGMKNSVYTNTVYLLLMVKSQRKFSAKIMVTEEWLCASADLFVCLFKPLM